MKFIHPITHPHNILFIVLLLVIAVSTTIFVEARVKGNVKNNPNPIIEAVVLDRALQPNGEDAITVSIQGYNFTDEDNAVYSRGEPLVTGLKAIVRFPIAGIEAYPGKSERGIGGSSTAKIIQFEIPKGRPLCAPEDNELCPFPLSVVNANGVSKSVFFNSQFGLPPHNQN